MCAPRHSAQDIRAVRVYVCMCVYLCVCITCIYIHTCRHTHTRAKDHVYITTESPLVCGTCMHACIHTYMYTHIQTIAFFLWLRGISTYMHAYIHIYTYSDCCFLFMAARHLCVFDHYQNDAGLFCCLGVRKTICISI